jgi:ubiquinone/menaquinone biosynthesis C-methylase UbiE
MLLKRLLTMSQTSKIQDDFDKIALFSSDNRWDHNNHYHKFLLKQMPSNCINALDIGCGTGLFARLFAKRSEHVLGLDLSPKMIQIAKERSKGYDNITYEIADVMNWDFHDGEFDCVASLATFHHLPLGDILVKMKNALKSNGVLMVLDLYKFDGIKDVPINIIAMPANIIVNFIKNGHLRKSKETKMIWDAHFANDHLLPLSHIHKICASVLPGAEIRRHLFWRYSIIWTKR